MSESSEMSMWSHLLQYAASQRKRAARTARRQRAARPGPFPSLPAHPAKAPHKPVVDHPVARKKIRPSVMDGSSSRLVRAGVVVVLVAVLIAYGSFSLPPGVRTVPIVYFNPDEAALNEVGCKRLSVSTLRARCGENRASPL
jgi:hypothetical protein